MYNIYMYFTMEKIKYIQKKKRRTISIRNPHVPITQLQPTATHGQSSFFYVCTHSPYPRLYKSTFHTLYNSKV